MKCPQCFRDNPDVALFCGGCGTSLSAFTTRGIGAASSDPPMVSFVGAIRLGFSNYFRFSGRSTRAEYWWWVLFFVVTYLGLGFITGLIRDLSPFGFLVAPGLLFLLGTLIPWLALGSRRLHDINRTGWWQLMWLVFPFIIPPIVLMVCALKQGDGNLNKYGPDPRRAATQVPDVSS